MQRDQICPRTQWEQGTWEPEHCGLERGSRVPGAPPRAWLTVTLFSQQPVLGQMALCVGKGISSHFALLPLVPGQPPPRRWAKKCRRIAFPKPWTELKGARRGGQRETEALNLETKWGGSKAHV